MVKLNLGCGFKKMEGFLNIDINEKCNPDMVYNLNNKLPFEDNSVDLIYSSLFLDHLEDTLSAFQNYCRVLKDGGLLRV